MTTPVPRVWLKWSAAVTDRNGKLWWPNFIGVGKTLGVQMPDGRRIPWSQLNPQHEVGDGRAH